jgi:S-adenosylmethionine hydrolase
VHAVIQRVAPGATVIDLTHNIAAHDVRAGALTLWRAVPWLAPGVLLGVVDPGVGTSRRAVALEVAGTGLHFVGPDNGLLLPAALRMGDISSAVDLLDPGPARPGATFAGRDIFAPAAARLAAGIPATALGELIDPSTLQGAPFPGASFDPGPPPCLRCAVTWIDRFGNIQLGASIGDLERLGSPTAVTVVLGDRTLAGLSVATSYAALAPGQLGVVIDSHQMLSLCLKEAPASRQIALQDGDCVRLSPA